MTDHALQRWLRTTGPSEVLSTLAALCPGAAVFAVDADRNVVLWSEGAQRLLGFSAEEMLGQHCLKANRCHACIQRCGIAERGEVAGVPIVLHREDGTTVAVRKSGRAFFGADGGFLGGIEVLVPEAAGVGLATEQVRGAADSEAAPSLLLAEGADVVRFHGLLTRDPLMVEALRTVRNVAETDATVLIRGESGTGKELVARGIHAESHRAAGPFLGVNCAALTPSLLESELFGHVRGAFTGAVRDRPGLFAQADGGTLFLDEVAELPLDLQAKLLRVLQERTFVPVGGTEAVRVDLRVVAATHRSMREQVAAGKFREDLMYRLRVVPVFLPPLRERRLDVPLLLEHFIGRANAAGPRRIQRVAPDAMRMLLDHDWPGNVRELQNVVQYAAAVGRGPELLPSELPPEFREHAAPRPAAPSVTGPEDEAAALRDALARAGGNVGEAAELLGMSRTTFWRARRRHGL